MPQDVPNETRLGWSGHSVGASTPVFGGLQGTIAPASPAAVGSLTLVTVAAGLASIAFIVAIAALWGIVVPSTWMPLAAVIGAVSSTTLFLIYLSPLSIVPLLANLAVLWGVFVADWTSQSLGEVVTRPERNTS